MHLSVVTEMELRRGPGASEDRKHLDAGPRVGAAVPIGRAHGEAEAERGMIRPKPHAAGPPGTRPAARPRVMVRSSVGQ